MWSSAARFLSIFFDQERMGKNFSRKSIRLNEIRVLVLVSEKNLLRSRDSSQNKYAHFSHNKKTFEAIEYFLSQEKMFLF